MPGAVRLDSYLSQAALARSRNQAQRMIKAGQVAVDGVVELRPSALIGPNQQVLVDDGDKYVSRAAYKLTQALENFALPPLTEKWAVDIGASTGGFTQVLLERGASCVFSIDVGTGQLSPDLLADSRVFSLESTDARTVSVASLMQLAAAGNVGLTRSSLGLVVIDVSFISLGHFLPLFSEEFNDVPIVALFKPQFEVGRAGLGKGGVVKNSELARLALRDFESKVVSLGGEVLAVEKSETIGSHGNQEFLLWITFPGLLHQGEWSSEPQASGSTLEALGSTGIPDQAAAPNEEV